MEKASGAPANRKRLAARSRDLSTRALPLLIELLVRQLADVFHVRGVDLRKIHPKIVFEKRLDFVRLEAVYGSTMRADLKKLLSEAKSQAKCRA